MISSINAPQKRSSSLLLTKNFSALFLVLSKSSIPGVRDSIIIHISTPSLPGPAFIWAVVMCLIRGKISLFQSEFSPESFAASLWISSNAYMTMESSASRKLALPLMIPSSGSSSATSSILRIGTASSNRPSTAMAMRLSTSDDIPTKSLSPTPESNQETISIPCTEFVRRFLMHVLPAGFQKIRYYGLFCNRFKAQNLALIFRIQGSRKFSEKFAGCSSVEVILMAFGKDLTACPNCGFSRLKARASPA